MLIGETYIPICTCTHAYTVCLCMFMCLCKYDYSERKKFHLWELQSADIFLSRAREWIFSTLLDHTVLYPLSSAIVVKLPQMICKEMNMAVFQRLYLVIPGSAVFWPLIPEWTLIDILPGMRAFSPPQIRTMVYKLRLGYLNINCCLRCANLHRVIQIIVDVTLLNSESDLGEFTAGAWN